MSPTKLRKHCLDIFNSCGNKNREGAYNKV